MRKIKVVLCICALMTAAAAILVSARMEVHAQDKRGNKASSKANAGDHSKSSMTTDDVTTIHIVNCRVQENPAHVKFQVQFVTNDSSGQIIFTEPGVMRDRRKFIGPSQPALFELTSPPPENATKSSTHGYVFDYNSKDCKSFAPITKDVKAGTKIPIVLTSDPYDITVP
jgi:hypothetical protein